MRGIIQKAECVSVFFFLPPSGWRVFRLWSSCTCSQMHAEPTALRRILFQVPNVGVWWFIWCQVDSCGDNTCSSASAKDASWCNGKLFYLRIKLKTRDSLFTFIITHPVKTCWKEMGFARRLNSSELSLLSSQHFWAQFFFECRTATWRLDVFAHLFTSTCKFNSFSMVRCMATLFIQSSGLS